MCHPRFQRCVFERAIDLWLKRNRINSLDSTLLNNTIVPFKWTSLSDRIWVVQGKVVFVKSKFCVQLPGSDDIIGLLQQQEGFLHPDLFICVDLPVWLLLLDRYCRMLLDETPLFDPSLLQDLDWSSSTVSFSPPISPSSPGEGLVLRPLCTADFNRGESNTSDNTTWIKLSYILRNR